jgi:endonuclease YncB( thermonuclease family)
MTPAKEEYNAIVVYWHDGDTAYCVIELSAVDKLYKGSYENPWPVRLADCNANELKDLGGKEALENVMTICPEGTPIVLRNVRKDPYERWDASIETPLARDLGMFLEVEGWVARYPGSGPKVKPLWPRVAHH